MKRYYVDHRRGAMNEEERAQFTSLLKQEGLYDESRGPLYCLIPRPDGVLLEKDFLHLWEDRKEAEAFARKIPQRSPGIWRVFEENVVPVYQFLAFDRLGLPERPRVVDIKPEVFNDQFGRDNLHLFVILGDDTTEEEWAWRNLAETDEAILESLCADLREEGLELRPIIWHKTESEYAEEQKEGLAL